MPRFDRSQRIARLPAAGPLAVLLLTLGLSLGCRALETSEDLPALAGDARKEPSEATAAPPDDTAPAAAVASTAGGAGPAANRDLDGFPLVGSVFPGLGGRLHSSLCDPASEPYGNCI